MKKLFAQIKHLSRLMDRDPLSVETATALGQAVKTLQKEPCPYSRYVGETFTRCEGQEGHDGPHHFGGK